jgi:hypothetical protein
MPKKRFTLFPHQAAFVNDDDTPILAIGGSVGPGKTVATVIKCRRKLQRQLEAGVAPYGLFIRRELTDLMDSVENVWFTMFPNDRKFWRENRKEIRYPNGAKMNFRHGSDKKVLLGPSYTFIAIEQAEEMDEDIFEYALTRVRGDAIEKQIFINFNINGHDWIYRMFKVNDMKRVGGQKHDPEIKLIECKTTDNPELDKFYWNNLKKLPEHKYNRLVNADWEAGSNLVYPDFDRRLNVIAPIVIPPEWERVIGCDWGQRNPTACVDARIDYDGNIYIVNEYYSPGLVSEHAKEIKKLLNGDEFAPNITPEYMLLDPACWSLIREKNGMESCIADEFADYGLYFDKANNNKNTVHGGINRVSEYIRFDPEHIHPLTGELGSPRLFIFDRCSYLINEITEYKNEVWKDDSPKERPKKGMGVSDHLCDATRYVINSRPGVPEIVKTPEYGSVQYMWQEYKNRNRRGSDGSFILSEVF